VDPGRHRSELIGRLLGAAKLAVPRPLRPRLGRFDPQYRPRALTVPASYLRVTTPVSPPSISIVVPSLNQGRFIGATLASIAAQRYPRLEWIVADGGSTDGALDVLAEYRDQIDRLEIGPDRGQAPAINRELDRARGEILCWLNSDDLLLPGALAYVGSFFAARPDVDLVYGYRVLIDEHGDDIGIWTMPPHSPAALDAIDLVPQEAAFWRRGLWERLGGLSEEIEIAFDWDFFRRAEAAGAKIVRLPRFLGAMRQHPGQKTRARDPQSQAEQEAIRARDGGRPLTKAQVRVRLLGYLLRGLPYQYAHLLRARLGSRRTRVPLPAPAPTPVPPDGVSAETDRDPISLASRAPRSGGKGGSG
jgi:hypothetical protein